MGNQPWPPFQNGIRERSIVKLNRIFTHVFHLLPPFRENEKSKSNPEFMYLNSEIVVFGGHLPKQVIVEGATSNIKIFRERKFRQQ